MATKPFQPPPRRLGTASATAKLDDAKVRAIRWAHARGTTIKALAEQYGVSTATVSSVVNHISWGHVR